MRWRGIVKAQRSIVSSVGPQMLVYNQDRSLFVQFDMTPEELDKVFGKGELKIYLFAVLNDKGELGLFEPVPEQDW